MDIIRGTAAIKEPNPIDRHIGNQLRLVRKLHGLSQEGLAERLRVTYQQVQKYEKGRNRVAASRLFHAALIFDVPISFFFPTNDSVLSTCPRRSASPRETVVDLSASPEAADLIISFSHIQDSTLRRRVLGLVRVLASRSAGTIE
jgi:transcriptional regulator with XRE-family HTH domain